MRLGWKAEHAYNKGKLPKKGKLYKGHLVIGHLHQCGDIMKYTRFEKARIIGSRALQISFGAPILAKDCDDLTDPIEIATREFDQGVIPITVVKK